MKNTCKLQKLIGSFSKRQKICKNFYEFTRQRLSTFSNPLISLYPFHRHLFCPLFPSQISAINQRPPALKKKPFFHNSIWRYILENRVNTQLLFRKFLFWIKKIMKGLKSTYNSSNKNFSKMEISTSNSCWFTIRQSKIDGKMG